MKNYFISVILLIVFLISLTNCSKENKAMMLEPEENIKKVIEESYIDGIHKTQDEKLIGKGFHKDFNMLVLQKNNIEKVDIEGWLKRIEKMKLDNPELWKAKTTCKFILVDVTGNSAVAKLEVYKGEIHFSTDYMLLYKFEEGWEIVSKIYNVRQS
jgi:hypothetical protein